jgi:hypothetical protein
MRGFLAVLLVVVALPAAAKQQQHHHHHHPGPRFVLADGGETLAYAMVHSGLSALDIPVRLVKPDGSDGGPAPAGGVVVVDDSVNAHATFSAGVIHLVIDRAKLTNTIVRYQFPSGEIWQATVYVEP